jgi:small subunit ribosomal protein S27Ae
MKKTEFFKIEGNKINRVRRHCPKCGPGVFIAEHKNRYSCGKCGYTEFKSGGKKEQNSQEKSDIKEPEKQDMTQEQTSVKEESKPPEGQDQPVELDEKTEEKSGEKEK